MTGSFGRNDGRQLTDRQLLLKRDALISHLREHHVPGVVSAGLSRRDGHPVLNVLVKSLSTGPIPPSFQGMSVVVTQVNRASV
jgi:hypothetical protein